MFNYLCARVLLSLDSKWIKERVGESLNLNGFERTDRSH